MTGKIDSFKGAWEFLSNFWPCRITHDGIEYPTTEHAYQALKTTNKDIRRAIAQAASPYLAKKAGKAVQLREDWEQVKVPVMRFLLRLKFYHAPYTKALLATGDDQLIEGNYWKDTFWGVCDGVGENWLGRLLMEIREELREVDGGYKATAAPDQVGV
jgi:ribA/ribD-fused uncharacterized protein